MSRHSRLFQFLCLSICIQLIVFGRTSVATAAPQGANNQASSQKRAFQFDPAQFVKIYEHSGNRWVLLYSWEDGLRSRQLRADPGSLLIVQPDLDKADRNTIINNLYITAQISGGDKSVDIPVLGYSEIGKSADGAASQKAVSFQTLKDIKNNVSTIYWTSREIINAIDSACWTAITTNPESYQCKGLPVKVEGGSTSADPIVTAAFIHKDAEINSIAKGLSDPMNIEISRVIGDAVFGLSGAATAAIAAQYAADYKVVSSTDNSIKSEQIAKAAGSLYERTQLIIRDFCLSMLHPPVFPPASTAVPLKCAKSEDVETFLDGASDIAVVKLKKMVIPGQIVLAAGKAQDGQSATITVESKGKGAGGAGATAVFDVSLRNFGTKVSISPSVLFITRVAVNTADLARTKPRFTGDTAPVSNPIAPVSGAPFPGVSLLFTHYHRGVHRVEDDLKALLDKDERPLYFRARSSKSDKFLNALAPGLGVNTTFMSFSDPRDFDVTTSQFTKTTGSSFQLGVGPVVSLFNNAVQLTYGRNWNVDQRQYYFGMGFGFVEVGKTFASFIKKQQ